MGKTFKLNYFDHLGFTNIILNFDPSFNYTTLLKSRLHDQFIQEWGNCINNTSKLNYYERFKSTFCYEGYIDKIENDSLRKQFSCLRLTSHCLEIEFGRFNGINRENRFCKFCPSTILYFVVLDTQKLELNI